jgi:Trp operon repressor
LIEGLTKINSLQEMEKSLNLLLTSHEKTQMIKRASVISLLKQGKSYTRLNIALTC